jgi:hypothetical protein
MEHIGRELRRLYPPLDAPPGLHDLFTEERRRAAAMHRKDRQVQKREGEGDWLHSAGDEILNRISTRL